nr:hypothetical protein [uncultured Rhodopila sp.]
MRHLLVAFACLCLAACGNNPAGTACLEDAGGTVLAAGLTAAQAPGSINGKTATAAGTTILVDAAKDPNCLQAIQTALNPAPAAPVTSISTAPAAASATAAPPASP